MDIQKKVDLLNRRLDKLDNDYSCTLAQVMTDVHSLKDNEKERKETAKRDSEWGFNLIGFVVKVFAISLLSALAISIVLGTVKDLFF